MDTVNLVDEGYDLYVRVDAIELETLTPKGLLGLKKVLVISVASTWLVVICFAYLWLRKKQRKRVNRKLLNAISGYSRNEVGDRRNRLDVEIFSLGTLVAATNNFSPANRLGQGGFGIVYKGQLSNVEAWIPCFLMKQGKIFQSDQLQERTKRIAGTYGYMSPEYVAFGRFSVKSDVFSYGVILLEIISGKKNNGFLEESSLSLIDHVWQLWKEDRAVEIVDSSFGCCDQVLRCTQIGLLCVQQNAMDRPTMLDVVVMLNSNTTLPTPTQPAFTYRKVCNNFSSPTRDGSCSKNELTISNFVGR
ncbi:Cysteine-rich receptor-like protein kinase 41 [Euphorbia peplus]|nr:Cysteine-rich receptor-like protein kinase 41 [Euphorbia peplus]